MDPEATSNAAPAIPNQDRRGSDGDAVGVLLADHALYRLEADLRWIDHTAARLDLLSRAVRR